MKERILLKLTSTKTWFLIASILTAAASYIGGAAMVIPDWLATTGLWCGFAGGGIYALAAAYQNAQEAMAKASTTSTTVTATTSTAKTVEKLAGIE